MNPIQTDAKQKAPMARSPMFDFDIFISIAGLYSYIATGQTERLVNDESISPIIERIEKNCRYKIFRISSRHVNESVILADSSLDGAGTTANAPATRPAWLALPLAFP